MKFGNLTSSKENELLIIEMAKADAKESSTKAKNDDIKIIEGIKDMLDRLLLGVLNGITIAEMQRVYTVGIQVIGK